MAEFRMPSLGADMDAATLTEWLVRPGDEVERGDIVATIETTKGILDVEIFDSGRIDELLVEPGTEALVGTPLARYTPATGAQPEAPGGAEHPGTAGGERPGTTRRVPAAPTTRPRISPAARRRAEALGVDLSRIEGTGPDRAITVGDVERGAPRPGTRAPPATGERRPDIRSTIGQAMSRSKREIPHYYLATTIDMSSCASFLDRWNAEHDVTERLLVSALLVKALARALERFPEFNGFWREDRFDASTAINVGVAIRLRRGGLVAPGLAAANELPLAALMLRLKELVQRARAGHLRQSELTNATITLSSLGEDGVEALYPIIYPPQVAIVGFGGLLTRPWARGDQVVLAPLITATLSGDHRVSDGHRGSQFLGEIDRLLQRPEEL